MMAAIAKQSINIESYWHHRTALHWSLLPKNKTYLSTLETFSV